MAPLDLSRLIVHCTEKRPARNVVIGAGPAIAAVVRLEEIDSVTILRADDERSRGRIETGRPVVGGAALIRRYEPAVLRGFFFGIRNRTAFLVDTLCPIHDRKR